MGVSLPSQFHLKLSTLLVVFIYIASFISSTQAAYQVTSSSYATKPAKFLPRKMQQQDYNVSEAVDKNKTHQPQHELVDLQLRMVPSGPDPLHHHRAVPKRPQTP